jgi:BirA family biotin operon repressor/biotin-[acetyl-CoA-carboxylase] ligase
MQTQKAFNLIYFPEITSTNTHALRNIADFLDRDVLMAEIQTEGRGRFDRKWISDKPENIYISFVLKPPVILSDQRERENLSDGIYKHQAQSNNSSLDRSSHFAEDDNRNEHQKQPGLFPLNNIPQYLSVKLCEILENYGISPVIKWPNDVLINGKKIAGILAQTSIRGNTFKGLVLGIGVNLNFEKADMEKIDRPATSLNLVLGEKIDRDAFLKKFLNGFFENYDNFLNNGFDFIKHDYVKRAYFLGNTVTVNTYNSEVRGIAKKIADDGSLVIIPENCENELIINMGEILEF